MSLACIRRQRNPAVQLQYPKRPIRKWHSVVDHQDVEAVVAEAAVAARPADAAAAVAVSVVDAGADAVVDGECGLIPDVLCHEISCAVRLHE